MKSTFCYIFSFFLLISFTSVCRTNKSVAVSQNPEIIPDEHFENIAQKFANEAQFKSSNFYLKKAIEIYKSNKQWEKVIRCHIKIGNNFQQIEGHKMALEHFNQALKLALSQSEYHHTDLAKYFQKMAFKHFNNKEYDLALELYNKALAVQLKVFNENHVEVAKSYNSIALVYWNKGDDMLFMIKKKLRRSSTTK